LLDSLQS